LAKIRLDIETQQLLFFSKHYLHLAKRLKCSSTDLTKTIEQLFAIYQNHKASNVYLFLAHLASSAYRAATIIEKYNNELAHYNYRRQLKNKEPSQLESELHGNLQKFLPMMLRDLIGHRLKSDHKFLKPRNKVLHALKPIECKEILECSLRDIEEELKHLTNTCTEL
jgi:hypothetical protein